MAEKLQFESLIKTHRYWKWNDKKPYYWNYLKKRMLFGFNPILVIVGKPRMGKTWVGLDIALELDKDFSSETSYYISLKDFIMDLAKLQGRVIIIDDPGSKLSTFQWSSIWNQAFSFILQTQGYKNNCFILIVPHIKYVIKAHRYMVDLMAEVFARGCAKFNIIRTNWGEMRPNRDMYRMNVESVIGFPRPPLKILKRAVEKEIIGKKEIYRDIRIMINEHEKVKDEMFDFNPKRFYDSLKNPAKPSK